MKNLWLSIHPRWIAEILAGRKTVELRRRAPDVERGARAVLYATSPDSSVVGSATVAAVIELPLAALWDCYAQRAAVSHSEFLSYFDGCVTGAAIELTAVEQLEDPVGLASIREAGFQPAQGWMYLSDGATEALVGPEAAVASSSRAG